MTEKLLVPDIGEFENVEVIELLVKPGQEIKKNDPVITIESDKSSVEIPSTIEGKIEKVEVKIGDKVSKGDLLLVVSGNNISPSALEEVPKNTENLIKEAETSREKIKEKDENSLEREIKQKNESKIIKRQKPEIIQSLSKGDLDPLETNDWLDSLTAVIEKDGNQRAHYLIKELINKAYMEGANIPYTQNTPYINTIPVNEEKKSNGDQNIERRIRSLIRWNAAAMVVRANKKFPELGGHIGTFASAATLYDVGMNHFWRAKNNKFGGDLIYFQGHSAPGMYARAYLEGRLNEKQLDSFRQEVNPGGLSSYPHPWLMPNFWQFPTVSMGLGPMLAIYQARFMKYLINRGLIKDEGRKVWAFLGDGEMDEPESLGAIGLAAREKLDNLIFVVNCNLQRLDGPVRGNGKIIQELEGIFRGADGML